MDLEFSDSKLIDTEIPDGVNSDNAQGETKKSENIQDSLIVVQVDGGYHKKDESIDIGDCVPMVQPENVRADLIVVLQQEENDNSTIELNTQVGKFNENRNKVELGSNPTSTEETDIVLKVDEIEVENVNISQTQSSSKNKGLKEGNTIRGSSTHKPLFKCDFCDQRFNLRNSLKKHILSHSSKEVYECKKCGKLFQMKCTLSRHRGESCLKCCVCGVKFDEKLHFFQHFNLMHGDKKHCVQYIDFFQEDCGEALYNQSILNIAKSFSNENQIICVICGSLFSNSNELVDHHSSSHMERTEFKCKQCPIICGSKRKLQQHEQLHTGIKPFECEHCHKTFPRKDTLKRHLLQHTGEKPFSCPQCEGKFSTSSSLILHMTIHSDDRPFKCFHCEKSFKRKKDMNRHIRLMHTKERLHSCSFCERGFLTPRKLEIHKKTHLDANNKKKSVEKTDNVEKRGSSRQKKSPVKVSLTIVASSDEDIP